jgi:hypothetical protein
MEFDALPSERSSTETPIAPSNSATPSSPRLDQAKASPPVGVKAPSCAKCRNTLTVGEDMQRKSQGFWKNCKSCRDKNTSHRRKLRESKIETRKRKKLSRQELNKSEEIDKPVKEVEASTTIEPTQDHQTSERVCSVCADSFPAQDFLSLSSCAHQAEVCQQCFLQWLNDKINSTDSEQIQCPASGCKNAITHNDVRVYAPNEVFTRYYLNTLYC